MYYLHLQSYFIPVVLPISSWEYLIQRLTYPENYLTTVQFVIWNIDDRSITISIIYSKYRFKSFLKFTLNWHYMEN